MNNLKLAFLPGHLEGATFSVASRSQVPWASSGHPKSSRDNVISNTTQKEIDVSCQNFVGQKG